jgi:hypothetical protein
VKRFYLKSVFKSAVEKSTRILILVVHQAEMSLRNSLAQLYVCRYEAEFFPGALCITFVFMATWG